MRAAASRVRVDVFVDAGDTQRMLEHDVRSGLADTPKHLPPKWFYDARGSALFDEITRLAEYYPTRCEREILVREAPSIARASAEGGVRTLVELGSGTSEKTRILLDALSAACGLRRFVPFDVSEETLRAASHDVADAFPSLRVHAVAGDFERHLDRLPIAGRTLVAFLGGTIGNLVPAPRADLLQSLAKILAPGDLLLLGTDLVKDPDRLVAAYDDPTGVTAAFNRNVLHVVNRALGSDFAPDRFAHRALWDAEEEWMEMSLVATEEMDVHVPVMGDPVHFAAGESMRTEISAKFRRSGIEDELAASGFAMVSWMTDSREDFAVSLARRA